MISPTPSPQDLQRLIVMFDVLVRFGSRLAVAAQDAVDQLQATAGSAVDRDSEETATRQVEDEAAQQRADDDGWPPAH